MKVYAPELAYRGTRDYVHSTDLYAELLVGCESVGMGRADGPLVLTMRRRLALQPEFMFFDASEEPDRRIGGAEFVATIAGRRISGAVRETDRPVLRRKPYDERGIWERAVLSTNVVTLREASEAAPIEVVTALGVLQHRTLRPPPDGHRWMLARLDIERPLTSADTASIEITLRRHVGRLTRSDIASRGRVLGVMDFLLS